MPIKTRHQEVAPNQFEVAPIFEQAHIAADHNLLLMTLMREVASKHNLSILFHEKPFAGYNGSGKHNNWSVGTETISTIFKPDYENPVFKIGLAAVIRGVDLNQDLLRWAIASASNDLRLGANEAPPSIISVFLGTTISNYVDTLISGTQYPDESTYLDLGIPFLCPFSVQTTDRNRTSPFAFTGNKFEVRAVGASQSPAMSSCMLNTLTADSFLFLANEIEELKNSGTSIEQAIDKVCKETLAKHKNVIFDGNGYESAWVEEAERRGLLNLRTTPDTLNYILNDKNYSTLEKLKIFTRNEFECYVQADADNYSNTIFLEAKSLIVLSDKYIIPTSVDYIKNITSVSDDSMKLKLSGLNDRYTKLQILVDKAISKCEDLKHALHSIEHEGLAPIKKAERTGTTICPIMHLLRKDLDSLEAIIPANLWPISSYDDLLYAHR